MTSSISVVIPVYNRPELVQRAVDSVHCQSLPPLEIIVVDDGSSPPLDALNPSLQTKVRILRQGCNRGVSAARNLGITEARGEWIALLDSDDEWAPEKLKKQSEYLQNNKGISAVQTGERWIRKGNEVIPPNYLNKSTHDLWNRSLKHCLICPSSVLLHRSVFQKVGWFNENLPVCEDYEFWLRLLLQFECGLVEEKLVTKHGGHPDQLSTTTWGMDRFRVKALQNLLESPHLTQKQDAEARSVLVEKCMILAHGSEKRNKLKDASRYRKLAQTYGSLVIEHNQSRILTK